MIHIFYVPGMFGSMIEMALRSFTDLDGTLQPLLRQDGSAHTFSKQHHPKAIGDIVIADPDTKITTPIYPFPDTKLEQIFVEFSNAVSSWPSDQKILIHAPDTKWAEINLLFQYHKISLGCQQGPEIFGGNVNRNDIKQWNDLYDNWQQMSRWEYREWLSLFYPKWISEWIDSKNQAPEDFLILSNQSILESTHECLSRIVDFCGLQFVRPIDEFIDEYRDKQRYILQEYEIIQKIIDSYHDQTDFTWAPLSIVGEAILQNHFRMANYEWFCHGLDTLPTNSVEFRKHIYQSTEDLHA
jgi:hypothetical protein